MPHDSSILGAAALSREPYILQPAVVYKEIWGQEVSDDEFDSKYRKDFEKRLFILRKQASHTIDYTIGSTFVHFPIKPLSTKVNWRLNKFIHTIMI